MPFLLARERAMKAFHRLSPLKGVRGGAAVRSVSTVDHLGVLAGVVVLFGAVIGCSSAADTGFGSPQPSDDGGASMDAAAPQDSAAGTADSVAPDSGSPAPPDSGAPDTGSPPPPVDAGVDTGPVTSGDGFGASRTACINKINALRAANTAVALQPYTLQDTDMLDQCVDTQASTDESMNVPHYAANNKMPWCPWGSSNAFGQNECAQGYGTTPAAIEQCIQDMWDESLKPNCTGCVGCTQFGGACPNCDYYGNMGYECGHYVNLSAPYFTMVACGFAGMAPSSPDGWSVQNFE
jgi:hypothetical protein